MHPESEKVISEYLSQVGQVVQKQEKGFAAVHNKLEPPNTGNTLVSRQMKAESDTMELNRGILYTNTVQHFLLFTTKASEFIKC